MSADDIDHGRRYRGMRTNVSKVPVRFDIWLLGFGEALTTAANFYRLSIIDCVFWISTSSIDFLVLRIGSCPKVYFLGVLDTVVPAVDICSANRFDRGRIEPFILEVIRHNDLRDVTSIDRWIGVAIIFI